MENSTATPAELANADAARAGDDAAAGSSTSSASQMTLTFSFEEAEALSHWLPGPAHDGAFAGDDPEVRPALMKLRSAVEHAQAITNVRHELEQAGIAAQHLSDQQVAQLGRRIAQSAPALGGTQG